MGNSQNFLLALVPFLLSISCFESSPLELLSPSPKVARCGDTYTVNLTSNGIFYKPFEPVLEHERCSWVFGIPGTRSYSVNVQFLGFPPEQKLLSFASFVRNDTNVTHYHPNGTGEFLIENSNVLIVTFQSHEKPAEGQMHTGFAIQVLALAEGEGFAHTETSKHFIEDPMANFFIKYPPSGNYGLNELSTFLFPPGDNLFKYGEKVTVIYHYIRLYGSCVDFIDSYFFNRDESTWDYNDRICYSNSSTILTQSNDMMLLVFRSNYTAGNAGFELTYSVC